MFADKFNANNRTYPSRERCPRRSVGFDAFHGQQQGSSVRIVFQIAVDDAHIVRKWIIHYSPATNRFVEDAEPYGFIVYLFIFSWQP